MTTSMTISTKLDTIFELRQASQELQAKAEELIASAIPQEVRDEIARIKEELDPRIQMVQEALNTLENEVKTEIANAEPGARVYGKHLFCSQTKGTVKYDALGIDAYAMNDEEFALKVAVYRDTGKPSARIYPITKGR